jgi:hypothetical protein
LTNEIWKDIPGYEGQYQVSNQGRVRSLDRYIEVSDPKRKPFKKYVSGQLLRPGKVKSGHLTVVLGRNLEGKPTSTPVHQLVLKTFMGDPKEDEEVRHLNGIPTDNRLENLQYGTRRENILDVFKIGKAWRKLTSNDVHDIRQRLAKGEKGRHIAKEYGLYETTISVIKTGRLYSWL